MYTPGSIRPGVQFRFERYFRTLREGTCCSRLFYEEHLSLLVVPFLSTRSLSILTFPLPSWLDVSCLFMCLVL